MTASQTSKTVLSLLAMALVMVFVVSGPFLAAPAGDDSCCTSTDDCCPDPVADEDEESADPDCCSDQCSACLSNCCSSATSLLVSHAWTETVGGMDDAPTIHRCPFPSAYHRAIYHPPRI